MAISNPLLESSIQGARGVLLNITGGPDLSLVEINEAANMVREAASSHDDNLIFGTVIDDRLQGEVKVTVIATGFSGERIGQLDAFDGEEAAAAPTYEPPKASVTAPARERDKEPTPTFDSDDLDIPAFLRNRR